MGSKKLTTNSGKSLTLSRSANLDDDDDDDVIVIVDKKIDGNADHNNNKNNNNNNNNNNNDNNNNDNDDNAAGSDDDNAALNEAREAQRIAELRREQERADAELVRRLMEEDEATQREREQQQQQQLRQTDAALRCVACQSTLGADAFMLDTCLHAYCRVCIVASVAACCRQWRAGDAPPQCVECQTPLLGAEVRALLNADELAAFELRQARSALTDSTYVACANAACGNIMERVPVSAKEARAVNKIELHRLEYRLRW